MFSDPVCEVVQPAIRGHNATLTCKMTYEWQARARHFNHPPKMNVSLGWDGAAGTTVRTAADPTTVSGTLETTMVIRTDDISGPVIPSYDCSIAFSFSPGFTPLYQYAVNPASYTCATEPTTLWRKQKLYIPYTSVILVMTF